MFSIVLSVDEIYKLQAQNKGLIEQNRQLQQDISTLQGKLDAFQMSENEANEIIVELKAENEKLKAQLDVLEEDNKKLSNENDALYNNSLQEVKEDLVKRVWNLQTENKELAHYLACMTEQRNKANTCLQEIKGVVTALYMNNWLQMNETARKSIQLLQELITKAEEE